MRRGNRNRSLKQLLNLINTTFIESVPVHKMSSLHKIYN